MVENLTLKLVVKKEKKNSNYTLFSNLKYSVMKILV
jgi:hypothetical protein